MRVIGALFGGLLLAAPAQAEPLPADSYVLGDSLGEGVAEVSHVKGFAHVSVHIRGPRALEQLARTPEGATVFLVLGTNDAEGTIARLDKSIDDIVAAAARKSITLIWLGPPCVRQSWDKRGRDLDQMLARRFESTSVRYVSMRDAELCGGNLQEPDGVHLKAKGYVHMWEKATAAAGFTVEQAPTRIAAIPLSAPRSVPLPVPRRPLASDIPAFALAPAPRVPLPWAPLSADITGSIPRVR
jgi:lysophospholipase L1-like esterase